MSWYFMPDLTVKIGIGAWIISVLIPMFSLQRLESLVDKSEYLAASRFAKWVRWLAPTDGMWNYHHLLAGIALAQAGQIETAHQIFDRYQPAALPPQSSSSAALVKVDPTRRKQKLSSPTAIGRSATALLYRATDRWSEYITWFRWRLTTDRDLDRGNTLVYYVRALAETGDLHRCIIEVNKLDRDRLINNQQLNLLKMYLLAYCGRIDAVTQSCQNLLSTYSSDIHQFWIGTAELAAGKIETGTATLTQLRQTTQDRCIQHDIDWRLSQPLPDLTQLSSLDRESIAQIEAAILQDARYNVQTPVNARTPVTNLLIAINVLIFCAELAWQYKSGDKKFTFIPLGGLDASLVLDGQWWRIITANFLHMGILHLGMNMVALLYLGKFVEYRLGSFRYLLAYLIAGLGSMATITYIDTRWIAEHQITVGASGAIMGMLGAMGAIHLRGWRQAKVAAAGRQFQAVLFSVGFQLVFDLTNGHTSIVGHFSGLIIGFLVGLALLFLSKE
ncbi:rhomboid family intramembrane serine protease [Chamaesiphon sp. VAR_48_metabat_403]|uniref:rhomboid family intramembrane serine protease n=1 Tax=Chamaesiphon sp. VAR_48_metabat_403 TaxID=2964700 RepID=UPI00286D8166|nr:rhomboid family intramembrane serine protease [Chamaesiphon sp. VAR_48_metabat_403]